jgi:hypothetical protein
VSVLADCELLPDVPAAAPLAADTPNKALPKWTMTALDPGSQRMADQLQKYINEIYQYAQPSYFIPANTWTPPLAAQPAETHKCEFWCGKKSDAGEWLCGCNHADNAGCACPCHAQQAETKLRCPGCQTPTARLGGFCSRSCEKAKPAPQPAPAKCIDCGPTTSPLTMRIVGKRPALSWCDPCYLNYERTLSVLSPAQSGTPYTGPERLERPKLAHSSTWADECEDVR